MTHRWLAALLGMWMAACVCPPDKHELKAFAPAAQYQDAIKRCEATGDCAPLCFSVFAISNDEILQRCRIVDVYATGVHVNALVETPNTCASDGDLVIDDGDYVDDGGDSVDDGGDDGSTDDGSDDSGGDDGTVDDGGGDDGSTGDDGGGDDGGGDSGGGDDSAPKHAPKRAI